METIKYRGQDIQAEKMAELGGFMGSLRGRERNGEDELWRDEEGCYYLRRQRYTATKDGPQYMHEARGAGVLFDTVHCVGINTAILWAINNLSGDSFELRADAAGLLMDGRGYEDPNPVHLSATQREMVSDPDRFARQLEPGAASGRITVELDDLASAMLRKTCKEGDACRHPGENLRDLVNAAVTFYLSDDRNDQVGKFDLSQGDDALERAKHDRLKLEAAAPQTPPDLADEAKAVATLPGVHRFTFDYRATGRVCGRQRTIEVNDEQMKRAGELAAVFNLTPSQFLRGLADRNDLPGQSRRANNKLRDSLHAENIAFVCMDEAMAKRIERAAQARNQTADEFVAESLGGDVDMWEEAMLVHPTTGDLLEADYEELYTEVDYTYVVPPVGREHELQFKTHAGRKYVRFNAYLTPEQLERLEYPNMIFDCEANKDVPVLIVPFDTDGSPYLEVGGQRIQIGHTFPPAAAEEEAA